MRRVRLAGPAGAGRVRRPGAGSRHHHDRHGSPGLGLPRQRSRLQPERADVGGADAARPLWQRGAEARLAAAPRERRGDRRPRHHRARLGLGRVLPHLARGARARRIRPQRPEDVRHQRARGRRGAGVRLPAARRPVAGAHRVPGAARDEGRHVREADRQDGTPHLADGRGRVRGLFRTRGRAARPRRRGHAHLQLRDGVGARLHLRRAPGRHGAAPGRLHRLRQEAEAVRPADRQVRGRRRPHRRHEGGDRGRALAALQGGLAHRAGEERRAGVRDGEAVRERDALEGGAGRAPAPWRLRLHEGVPYRARGARRALRNALLGHQRDAAEDHRQLPGAMNVHRLLPRLVTLSAERHASAPAIVMDGVTLDYSELEQRSNRFARSLVAHGVRRGDRVALWLPKSPDAIVALYGIMKAGAAYVPVDPASPALRLAYIARDCEVAGLVTTRDRAAALDEAFAGRASMRALWFADESDPRAELPRVAGLPGVPWAALATEDPRAFDSPALEDDLAYTLYTSSSTGEPKGVMLSHRNCRVFTDWAAETFALTERD